MNFEDGSSDPYKILGVPFGASIEVCKATYRSLAKTYHPDIFTGEKAFAENRMAELNAAYEFLSDPTKKAEFDRSGEKSQQTEQNQAYEPDSDSQEFSDASNLLKETWNFACEYHPELTDLYQGLKNLSPKAAFVFMAVIVDQQLYENAKELAAYLEKDFLKSKFSEDEDLQKLAKYAILQNERQFCKNLNKALKILGAGSKEKILTKLSKDFPQFTGVAYPKCGLNKYQINKNSFDDEDFSELKKAYLKDYPPGGKRPNNW